MSTFWSRSCLGKPLFILELQNTFFCFLKVRASIIKSPVRTESNISVFPQFITLFRQIHVISLQLKGNLRKYKLSKDNWIWLVNKFMCMWLLYPYAHEYVHNTFSDLTVWKSILWKQFMEASSALIWLPFNGEICLFNQVFFWKEIIVSLWYCKGPKWCKVYLGMLSVLDDV